MGLGFIPIFLIVIAGIVAVVSIVACCCACICGQNPLCCLGFGLLAALGLQKPQQERQALVIHHTPGYQPTSNMVPSAPPPPMDAYKYEPVYATAVAIDPSAPPQSVTVGQERRAAPTQSPWPDPPRHTGLRDAWAMWLFLLSVAFVVCLAIRYGLPYIGVWEKNIADTGAEGWDSKYEHATQRLLLLCVGLAVVGDVLAIGWLHIMLRHPGTLVAVVLWSSAVTSILLSLIAILLGLFNAFIVFGILSVWSVCLLSHESHRIYLASANLRVACLAIGNHLGLVGVAYAAVVAQLLWTCIWTLGALGVYGELQSDPHTHLYRVKHAALVVFMSLSLYWGQQVIQNILHCTVVGSVANWYYTPDLQSPVGSAFRRATTLSLGSICLGSLTVALVSTARGIVQSFISFKALGSCVACIIDAMLASVEALFQNFNRYAYVFVGTWGYEFRCASRMAVGLFEAKGVDITVNEYVLSNLFWLGSLLIATLTGTIGIFAVHMLPLDFSPLWAPSAFAAVAGFLLGLSGCFILTDVLMSGVDTVFVCYWMDPTVLRTRRPDLYQELSCAWSDWEAYNTMVMEEVGRPIRATHIYIRDPPPLAGSTTTLIVNR